MFCKSNSFFIKSFTLNFLIMTTGITYSKCLVLIYFSFLFSMAVVSGQDMAPDPTTESLLLVPPSEEEVEKDQSFSISGFVDAYYQYSFNEQPFPTSFTETHNSFTLGMANVVLSKEGKVGFVADLAVGPRAEVANGYTGSTLSAIKQLYVTYSPSDKVTFTLGNFGTHVGYEVIDAPANVNYSTSYMFSNGPFYHTGLKVDFQATEYVGLMLGVLNDTDSKIDEVSGKHLGAQLSFVKDDLAVFVNYLGGKDDEISFDTVTFDVKGHQIDITATFQATEEFGLGLNATTKTVVVSEADNTSWFGAAIYANYAISDKFTLGLRGEYIGDDDGLITGTLDNSIFDFTLSGNIKVGALTLIPEFRVDVAGEEVFLDSDGEPTKTSAAVIFAAVYAF
ncbi:MAG: hypothetical protein ACI8P3_002169 [Saprospiraceae bacterium]|jgi:hypothetical protein